MSSEDEETRVDATELVVHAIIDRFTRRWQEDSSYRIERVLEEAVPIAEQHHVHLEAKDNLRSLKLKLIAVEVTARSSIGETVQEDEYCRRFPDLQEAIHKYFADRSHTPPEEDDPPMFSDAGGEPDFQGRSRIVKVRTDESQTGQLQVAIDRNGHESIPDTVGPYEKLTLIGKGSFGVVFRAFDRHHQREVALKFPLQHVLREAAHLSLFLQEAAKTENLDHPGIVPTYATERIDGFVFTVQKLIDGHTLQDELKEKKKRTFEEIAQLVAALADALSHASEKGIIHRDLKPANILIDSNDQPHIGDFGMALDENEQLGAHNVRCGTVPYMSPQLAKGLTRNLDGRTDIWSLGVIFYQLLTGNRKPFRGRTNDEILDQIQTRDPKPPRQVVPAVPRELERICLRCLEKPARDRYLTAMDLADDLRAWLSQPVARNNDTDRQKIMPRGLRAYRQEDAAFFLRLLPGPYDREGLPDGLRFWLNRIDPATGETARPPVGVLYGPTGSGKSSFVRAGLLPRLHRTDVLLIESTQEETEESLKQALAHRYPATARMDSLGEVLEELSKGTLQQDRKTLIVLDQFEQRLGRTDDYSNSDLATALSFCDGDKVQALLCVRDDFWLAMTRFADALEMDLREGVNAQSIDLFGTRHAIKVLGDLGRAYGCLPETEESESEAQQEFLRLAIDQLSEGGMVVCIQLVLLVELFRNRPWTVEELQRVGGVQGVAQRFLEETFDSPQAPKRLQIYSDPIKRVLECLLPESARGKLKTQPVGRADLATAVSESGDPVSIDTLIEILHDELRLISQTDEGNGIGYQLTHDFLVDPIRQWIFQAWRNTPSGRARIRLKELAALLPNDAAAPRHLPSHWEWLTWQYLLKRHQTSPREQRVLDAGRRRFWHATLTAVVTLLIVLIPTFLAYQEYTTQKNVEQLSARWSGALIQELPGNLPLLVQLQPRLQETLQQLSDSEVPDKELRGRLGLLPSDPGQLDRILELLLSPDSTPQQLEATAIILNTLDIKLQERLAQAAPDPPTPANFLRMAALGAQTRLDAPEPGDYARIAEGLASAPAETHWNWIQLLEPINAADEQFANELFAIFIRQTEQDDTAALAKAAFRYLPRENRARRMFDDLGNFSDYQFQVLIQLFLQYEGREELLAHLSKSVPNDEDASTKFAAHSIALLRLGSPEPYRSLMEDAAKLGRRAQAIRLSRPSRIPFSELRAFYTSQTDRTPLLKQAVLLAFADYLAAFDQQDLVWLDSVIRQTIVDDVDAGCFAAAEFLARRRGMDVLALRQERLDKHDPTGIHGNVLLSKALIPFVILKAETQNSDEKTATAPTRRIAVAMYELSKRDYLQIRPDKTEEIPRLDTPFVLNRYRDLYKVCNDISWVDNLDLPYTETTDITTRNPPAPHEGQSYHVIGEDIWKWIADQSIENHLSEGMEMTRRYCALPGSIDGPSPCGSYLPDHLGFFDLYGNAREMGLRFDGKTGTTVGFGATHRQSYSVMFAHKLSEKRDSDVIEQANGYVITSNTIYHLLPCVRLCRWLE